MNSDLIPDSCDVEDCMAHNPDKYPNLCSSCVILTLENIKNMPEERKNELFFTFKDHIDTGDFDGFIEDCCKEGKMSREEYEEIENEIWNEILKEG